MKDTDYAYGVARIRANERRLLTQAELDGLINSPGASSAYDALIRLGWAEKTDGTIDVKTAVRRQNERLWALLLDCVPDPEILKTLTVENDFFNIKAALKSMLGGESPKNLFAFPTSLDVDELSKAVSTHRFELLDGAFAEAARLAYEAAGTTLSGQSADIAIDKAALEYLQKTARDSGCPLVYETASFIAAAANAKTALRCVRTGKDRSFFERAVAGCEAFGKNELIEAALAGEKQLFDFLLKTELSDGVKLLSKSCAAFEKWCDDAVLEKTKKAKYIFFGFEPICAYYYAKQAEIKSVRIILGGKESGVSNEVIRERVRALYV